MTWVAVGVGGASLVFGGAQEKKARKRADKEEAALASYEADRDKRLRATRGVIDQAIDSPQRQAQYQTFANALRGYLGTQLGRKKQDTARQLKFSLARGGQTGGRVAVDANRRLGDEFADATIGNERNVQRSVMDLKGQDESTRLALHQLASSGIGLTEANRRTTEGLRSNLAAADVDAAGLNIGDAFNQTAATYKAINERDAMRRGLGYTARRADLYGGRV